MPNESLTSINSHIARNLSFKQLKAWSAAGASHRDELERIVNKIIHSFRHSTSPAKTLRAAMKILDDFFSRREVRGEVHLLNNRHIHFRLAFPTTTDDGLIFCLLNGEINARTGAVKFDLQNPIQISLHALQRLFERLNDSSEVAVLDEIYSCIGQVTHWHIAAKAIDAQCWPLISKNGFFIGTTQPDATTTTVVTWIKSGLIGRKWGLPLTNLMRLKERHREKLEDSEFAREFLRSFPWMLHDHIPGDDLLTLAWEQRDDQENYPSDDESALEDGQIIDKLVDVQSPKQSSSYISGLNYKNERPPFRTHTLHSGVVVQRRSNKSLIVGLRNGWVGQVPLKSIERGAHLITGYEPPDVGEDINVVVHKITYFPQEDAYAVSLDPKEIADAQWAEIEKEHVVGSICTVTVLTESKHEFMAKLDSGIRGVIPATEVHLYLSQTELQGSSPLGHTVETIVKGFRAEKKCLLLSIRDIDAISPPRPQFGQYPPGTTVHGKCIRKASNYASIALSHGVTGLLHQLNNWGHPLPEEGSDVNAIVIKATASSLLLAGIPPSSVERVFYAQPFSEDHWNQFLEQHSVGKTIEVQNLFWRESIYSYMVVTKDGVVGRLPSSEVDWLCVDREDQKLLLNPGDIFQAMILKIDPAKNRVIFSRKALEKHPIDTQLSNIDLHTPIRCIIIRVLDYGCFVQLHPFGIQALLHRSKIPAGKVFTKGDILDVLIDNVDQATRRVSVKLHFETPAT